MSLCICPRPTQQLEDSIDKLRAMPQTPEVRELLELQLRDLERAIAWHVDTAMRDSVPLKCFVCGGMAS